jgi:dTMP kinase
MSGFFIAFEGADGSGKSTQMRMLAEHLERLGASVVQTREPGGCPVAEEIREILLSKDEKTMEAVTEAMLYAAARAEHVQQVIKPALNEGKIVLCDRFLLSSLAYQGYGRQLGVEEVRHINEPAVSGCLPDATIFINVPPEHAFKRMNELKEYDRLERAGMSFHERVYNGYTELSKSEGVISVDAQGTKFETHEIIKKTVLPILKNAGMI